MRRLLPLLALAALTATGCMTGDGMQTKLRDASNAYNRSVRWGDWDRAAQYLPGVSQNAFMAKQDKFNERLVIVDYEVLRLELNKETGVAASRAQITWHTELNLVVEQTVVDQLWQFHEGNFVLVDERRSSGAPLAIFAELQETPHPYLPGLDRYRKSHEIGEENKNKKRKRKRKRSHRATAARDGR